MAAVCARTGLAGAGDAEHNHGGGEVRGLFEQMKQGDTTKKHGHALFYCLNTVCSLAFLHRVWLPRLLCCIRYALNESAKILTVKKLNLR